MPQSKGIYIHYTLLDTDNAMPCHRMPLEDLQTLTGMKIVRGYENVIKVETYVKNVVSLNCRAGF